MLAVILAGCAGPATSRLPSSRETLLIRGHEQSLYLYGSARGDPVILSSGDGGWIHLGPHVAEFLAAHGFFVVGFDVKAYLSSFTSRDATLRTEEEPGDYRVLADFATKATGRKPLLIGVSEGAGLSVLAATDPGHESRHHRRDRPRTSESERARLAVEGHDDLPDAPAPG